MKWGAKEYDICVSMEKSKIKANSMKIKITIYKRESAVLLEKF